MKNFTLFLLSASLLALGLAGGTAGCGGNPPDVAGTYDLTSTECPGFFGAVIEVTQDGGDITIDPDGVDLSGSIGSDGDFTVTDDEGGSCEGHFENGVATASCENADGDQCDITYERR
ncbi:MAG TPA: hypothetical protein VFX30_10385 [bacterium]|nr:hypothetical protein [bacterium]